MILDQEVVIPAPVDRVWAFLMDFPAVSRCVPGLESFEVLDADAYRGVLNVTVGPITVRLHGRVRVVERDREHLRSRLEVSADEKRISSSVNAIATMSLTTEGAQGTRLEIHTEAAILGKLGEFGQSILRRKADQIIEQFAANLAQAIAADPAEG